MLTLLLASIFSFSLDPIEGLTPDRLNFFVIGEYSDLAEASGNIYAASGFGLTILDSELNAPKHFATASYSRMLTVSGNRLYLAGGNEVTVFKLSGSTPEELESYVLTGKITALAAGADFLAAGTEPSTLVIYSQEPSGLKPLAEFELAAPVKSLVFYGDILYAACGRGGLEIIKVSAQPVKLDGVQLSGVQALAVGETRLYAATDYSTMTIYSLDDPARPREVKTIPTQSPVLSLKYHKKYLYAAQGYQGYAVFTAQGSMLEGPEIIREGFIAHALPTSRGLYLAAGDNGVFRLEGKKPAQLSLTKRLIQDSPIQHTSASGAFWGVAAGRNKAYVVKFDQDSMTAVLAVPAPMNALAAELSGTSLFVADSGRGVSVFSIKDYPRMERKFDLFVPGTPMRFAFAEDQILVAAGRRGLRTLWICPCGPLKERSSLADGVYAVDVEGIDSLAYVADPDSGLRTVLMQPVGSEGLNLIELPTYPGTVSPVALLREGDTLYVADAVGAVITLDISDPLRPRQIAFIPLDSKPYGMALDQGTLYVALGEDGVLPIALSDPLAPKFKDIIPTPGKALAVAVSNGHLGVADFTSWVLIPLE